MKFICIFLIFFLIFPQFFSKKARKHNISLKNIPYPTNNSLIFDPESLLLSEDKAYLNEKLQAFTQIKVMTLIIKEISTHFPYKFKIKDHVLHDFMEKVQKKWKFHGVLLLITANEAKIRFFPHKNLNKTYINNKFSAKINGFIEPLLKKKDFSKAIDRAINELNNEFSQKKGENITKIILIVVIFVIFVAFMAIIKPKTPEEKEKIMKNQLKKEKFF